MTERFISELRKRAAEREPLTDEEEFVWKQRVVEVFQTAALADQFVPMEPEVSE